MFGIRFNNKRKYGYINLIIQYLMFLIIFCFICGSTNLIYSCHILPWLLLFIIESHVAYPEGKVITS